MTNENKPIIYVAWSNKQDASSYIATLKTVEAVDATPVVLDMVKSTDLEYDSNNKLVNATDEHGVLLKECARKVKEFNWRHSNVEEVLKDAKCIIFPGGTDISPTLCKVEQDWHGVKEDIDYVAERDVSDYILMSYVLEKDIPMLAICRGMQLLSIISGARAIGHIPNYFKELNADEMGVHRDPNRLHFVPHDVDIIDEDSLLYKSALQTKLFKVPSWHHQGVDNLESTDLVVTGVTTTNGITIVEAVEKKDKKFCLGVQFHPEVAVRKYIDKAGDAYKFMDYDSAISIFRKLKEVSYR